MKKTFFSVVIPVYNKEKFIKNTISSVLNQTFKDFELILINDGSTDKSIDVINSFEDSRIRLFSQENGGVSKARNKGIAEAKGDFIAFLDADDEWHIDKLNYFKNYIFNYNPDWLCSDYNIRYSNKYIKKDYNTDGIIDDIPSALNMGLSIWTSTVVIRKSILIDNNLLFNTNLQLAEDVLLWMELAIQVKKICYIHVPLSTYNRLDSDSLTYSITKEMIFSHVAVFSILNKKIFVYDNDYYKNEILSYIKMKANMILLSSAKSNNEKKHINYNSFNKKIIFDEKVLKLSKIISKLNLPISLINIIVNLLARIYKYMIIHRL